VTSDGSGVLKLEFALQEALSSSREPTVLHSIMLSRWLLCEPSRSTLEVAAFGDACRRACRTSVTRESGRALAGHLQEMRSDRLQAVMPGHTAILVESAKKIEAGLWTPHHGDRDGVVKRDHRVRRDAFEQLVQREDLRPVRVPGARCLVVDGGNGGLELVGAEWRSGQSICDQGNALGDVPRVPKHSILLFPGARCCRPIVCAQLGARQ
jgi:hypothetical protein